MTEEYEYIRIETYQEGKRVIREFKKVTDLKIVEKVENAPGFNVNSFDYVEEDGIQYTMHEIHGEIVERVSIKKLEK